MSNEITKKIRATVSLRVSTKGKLGRVMRSLRLNMANMGNSLHTEFVGPGHPGWVFTHPVSAPHTPTTSTEPHFKEANTLYTHTTSAEPPANTLYTHTTYANTLYSHVFLQRTSLLRKQRLLDVKYAVYSLRVRERTQRAPSSLSKASSRPKAVSYTHLTLPTNREV